MMLVRIPGRAKQFFMYWSINLERKTKGMKIHGFIKKPFTVMRLIKNGRKGRMMMVEKVNIARALNLSCLLIS